jgi:hypothetical protein
MVESNFSEEYLEEQIDDYKPLSKLSIAAFLLIIPGLVAPLVPALLLLVVLAVACAGLALAGMLKQPQVGKSLAILALLVGCFILSLVPAMSLKRRWMLEDVALQHADVWMEAMTDGRYYEAHQLATFFTERRPPNVSYETHYRPVVVEIQDEMSGNNPISKFEEYFSSEEPIIWMREHRAGLKVTARGKVQSQIVDSSTSRYSVTFDVNLEGAKPIALIMQRTVEELDGEPHWHVHDVFFSDEVLR